MAMLAKDPAARPATDEVVRSLEQIAGEMSHAWRGRRAWVAAAVAGGVVLSTFTASLWTRKPPPMVLRLSSRPLTGEEGRETSPALSPDGRFIVYSWRPTAGSSPVTLLREIGSDRRTVLPISPLFSWLPDSRRIGFVRRGADHDTLCTFDTNGSGEQEILQAWNIGHVKWASDGESILYVASARKHEAPHALFLYSTRTRQTRQLTAPPDSSPGDDWFAIAPDGKRLAFRRVFEFLSSDIFLIDLPFPRTPRQITFQGVTGDDLAWVSGGKAIVSTMLSGSNSSLWLFSPDSAQPPTRLTEVGVEVTSVQSAQNRNRLVWVSALDDTNIWSVPLAGGTPQRVISSAIRDLDIASSSLGLLAFRSDRSGAPEIWISTPDGGSQKRVTNLNARSGSPRWSPDGRRLVFDSRRGNGASDIYVMDCDPASFACGAPLQITDNPATDAIPSWSADGSSVYFASQRTGQWQVWKAAANGESAKTVQVTTKGGFFAAESADGKWLYYSRTDSEKVMGVWRKSLRGDSTPALGADDSGEMLLPLENRALATWVLGDRQIIYSASGNRNIPTEIWTFDLETHRKRMIHNTGDVPLARGLALTRDGADVLFAQLDRWQSNIVVADYEIVK
jgi:Tol biopolymer transport system component